MNLKTFYNFLVMLVMLALTACTSQKELTYFNDISGKTAEALNAENVYRYEARIVSGDELAIIVSAIDPKTVLSFNLPFVAHTSPTSSEIYAAPTMQPYTVENDGTINFPVLGKITVEHLTRKELINLLTEKLEVFVNEPIVNVRFLNKSYSVIGEVNVPGSYPFAKERISILDALASAGDINIYGKRDNVLISRENNGEIEFARINLNDESVFSSPYFYLQQNDVIYVSPNKVRSISSQNLPLYLSTATSISSVVAIIFSISQSQKN